MCEAGPSPGPGTRLRAGVPGRLTLGMEITSGSAVLAAESAGDGPDVLLVHAGVTDQRSWASVVERLPGRRSLTYDARGYGRTTYEPEDGWSSVGDAVAVLDAYDVAQAVVIGSSMGGRTSIDLTLLHPDRVRSTGPDRTGDQWRPRSDVRA